MEFTVECGICYTYELDHKIPVGRPVPPIRTISTVPPNRATSSVPSIRTTSTIPSQPCHPSVPSQPCHFNRAAHPCHPSVPSIHAIQLHHPQPYQPYPNRTTLYPRFSHC